MKKHLLMALLIMAPQAQAVEVGLLFGNCTLQGAYETYQGKTDSFCSRKTRPVTHLYIAHRWVLSKHWRAEIRGDHLSMLDDGEITDPDKRWKVNSGYVEAVTAGLVFVF